MKDVGRTLSWGALRSFIKKLPLGSATAREVDPEAAEWASPQKVTSMLADIFDLLALINSNITRLGGGKSRKHPKYERPGNKKTRRIGQGGGMSQEEMREWIERKRKEHRDG